MCRNGICACRPGYRPEGNMKCVEGEDTTTSSSTTFIYDSALGGACDSDTNCGGLVGDSMCRNGICACRSGYRPEGNMKCVEGEDTTTSSSTTSSSSTFIYDSALGGACDSDTNCGGLVGNSMCRNGICACRSGYRPEGNMKCVEGEDTTTSSSTTFIYGSALGGACDSNTNCRGLVGNSMCRNGICACRFGYRPQGNMKCVEDTTTVSTTTIIYDSILGGRCDSDMNCHGLIVNAMCLN
ncbi:unnamed protein product, partial [Rotaria sordida]